MTIHPSRRHVLGAGLAAIGGVGLTASTPTGAGGEASPPKARSAEALFPQPEPPANSRCIFFPPTHVIANNSLLNSNGLFTVANGELIAPFPLPKQSTVLEVHVLGDRQNDFVPQLHLEMHNPFADPPIQSLNEFDVPGGNGPFIEQILPEPITLQGIENLYLSMETNANSAYGGTAIFVQDQAAALTKWFDVPADMQRFFDSRQSKGGDGPIQGGASGEYVLDLLPLLEGIRQELGLDSIDATLADVNVTVINPQTTAGFVDVFPDTGVWPGTSTQNWYQRGSIVANTTDVGLFENRLRIRTSGPTDIAIDVRRLGCPVDVWTIPE